MTDFYEIEETLSRDEAFRELGSRAFWSSAYREYRASKAQEERHEFNSHIEED
jgi:hypothetical protein